MPGPAPTFTLPTIDSTHLRFGTKEVVCLTRAQLNDWVGVKVTPQHNAAVAIYKQGKRPEDFRFFASPSLDAQTVHAAMLSVMRSTVSDVEVKIGNIAVALANWYVLKPAG